MQAKRGLLRSSFKKKKCMGHVVSHTSRPPPSNTDAFSKWTIATPHFRPRPLEEGVDKWRTCTLSVIPVKTGIPWHQALRDPLFRGDDSYYAFIDTLRKGNAKGEVQAHGMILNAFVLVSMSGRKVESSGFPYKMQYSLEEDMRSLDRD